MVTVPSIPFLDPTRNLLFRKKKPKVAVNDTKTAAISANLPVNTKVAISQYPTVLIKARTGVKL